MNALMALAALARGTVGLLVLATAAAITAAAAQDQAACGQIRAACVAAGFMQGAARDGIGLQVHCMVPIMQARAQPSTARKALPKVSPQLVADCKTSNLRFGPPLSPPAELAEPPPPASPAAVPPPRQDIVLRPPRPITSEQRSAIAALPPDDQPETGPAKPLPPHLKRTTVDYPSKEAAGTIVIDTANTYLYLVLGNGKAMRYGIGVGRDGFTWSGAEKVTRMAEWPDWNPPEQMIARQPYLPRFMAGGEGNPLGARALYLGQTLYRIHGTNQPSTIGTFVSSGCIRLTNEDIADLYGRVQLGTRVVVLPGASPASIQPTRTAQPRQRSKAAAAEKPAAAPAPGVPPQAAPAQAQAEGGATDTTSAIPPLPATAVPPSNQEE